MATLLLQRGANARATDRTECSPLHYAARYGHTLTALLLLEAGSEARAAEVEGRTPLELAAEFDHVATASLLESWNRGERPTYVSCGGGHHVIRLGNS